MSEAEGEGQAGTPVFEPLIVNFCCNWCSYTGADLAGTSRIQNPPNIRIIRSDHGGAARRSDLSPAIARRMITYFGASRSSAAAQASRIEAPEFAELTDREREILNLIAQGHNNSAIAGQLVSSVKTVQNYVSSILSKLQVADRSQAIVRAREAGLGR